MSAVANSVAHIRKIDIWTIAKFQIKQNHQRITEL